MPSGRSSKNIFGILLTLVLVGLVTAKAAQAQTRKTGFSLSLGASINVPRGKDYDRTYVTLDFRSRFRLGRSIEVVPEIMGATTIFGPWWLYPGASLNIASGGLFFGTGVVLPLSYTNHSLEPGPPAPKVNIGLRGKHIILTAYFLGWVKRPSEDLAMHFFGLTLGYCF